ncbi:MAG: PDZ domain-containing protein [Syntrophomonadaceae bacterium]|nr:PDZ domain-containing protein [Syntrophomonadaceae bacterium]MDD3022844.1 PDZ domain-containing protein [Syntrophomonadaceae bacterium]
MEQSWEVLLMMGRVIMATFRSPLFIMLYIMLFGMVAWQYKRMEELSARLVGIKRRNYLYSALISTLAGLLGGIIGSILLVLVGIDLNNIGLIQLWIIAILLMLINPRFLCFAYAGGILSLFALLTGYIDINVAHLLALIAILHMAESILILLNGHFLAIPLYVKKKTGIHGAFNLQKFWPIPLIALVSMGYGDSSSGVEMPQWWPLLRDYTGFVSEQNYSLLPVLAILGYGDISTTTTPWLRAKKSAFNLFIFSLILLLLTIFAYRWNILLMAAALFSPLGHELLIWLGMREESNKKPLYTEAPRGLAVLDILPGSPARQAGMLSQDIIMSINGETVDLTGKLRDLGCEPGENIIQIMRKDTNIICRFKLSAGQHAGIIPVPAQSASKYLLISDDSIFYLVRRLWRSIKSRLV